MPFASLDLRLDADSDAAVRARWAALAGAGLPSLAHHRGTTNAPHVTLAAAPHLDAPTVRGAADRLAPLLPVAMPVAGLVVLGRGPFVLAELVLVPAALTELAADLRRDLSDGGVPFVPPFVAHVTLARRLPAARVGEALAVLADSPAPPVVHGTGLHHWDPAEGTLRTVLPAHGAGREDGAVRTDGGPATPRG